MLVDQTGVDHLIGPRCKSFWPPGRYFAAGDHENTIFVYDTGDDFSKFATLRGHSSFISHFDWSVEGDIICSNSGDYEQLFWKLSATGAKQTTDDVRDVQFATCTRVLGFTVMGIWQVCAVCMCAVCAVCAALGCAVCMCAMLCFVLCCALHLLCCDVCAMLFAVGNMAGRDGRD